MLRDTLVTIVNAEFGVDVVDLASSQTRRPILSIFETEVEDFSKYRLAKAYIRWTRDHSASDLSDVERDSWAKLIERISSALT